MELKSKTVALVSKGLSKMKSDGLDDISLLIVVSKRMVQAGSGFANFNGKRMNIGTIETSDEYYHANKKSIWEYEDKVVPAVAADVRTNIGSEETVFVELSTATKKGKLTVMKNAGPKEVHKFKTKWDEKNS